MVTACSEPTGIARFREAVDAGEPCRRLRLVRNDVLSELSDPERAEVNAALAEAGCTSGSAER